MTPLKAAKPDLGYFEKLLTKDTFLDITQNLDNLRRLIQPAHPNAVRFYSNTQQALKSWALNKGLREKSWIGVVSPYPNYIDSFIESNNFIKVQLPRDPEELMSFDFTRLSAICLSNPNLADSFIYPDTIFEELSTHFEKFPHLEILSEESTREFYFHHEAPLPGTFLNNKNPKCTVMSGTFGFSNDPFCWLVDNASTGPTQHIPLVPQQDCGHRIFALKQSRNLHQFQRRLFVMEHNLLRFADILRPLILTEDIQIPFWPKPRALYLLVDISKVLLASGLSSTQWCERVKAEYDLEIYPGDKLGAPGCVRICLASSIYNLVKVGRIFVKSFERKISRI